MTSLAEIANNMLRISGGDVALFERTTDTFAQNLDTLAKSATTASPTAKPAPARK